MSKLWWRNVCDIWWARDLQGMSRKRQGDMPHMLQPIWWRSEWHWRYSTINGLRLPISWIMKVNDSNTYYDVCTQNVNFDSSGFWEEVNSSKVFNIEFNRIYYYSFKHKMSMFLDWVLFPTESHWCCLIPPIPSTPLVAKPLQASIPNIVRSLCTHPCKVILEPDEDRASHEYA